MQYKTTSDCWMWSRADAATHYSIDERNIGGVDNKVSAFAYQSSGFYSTVRPVAYNGTHKQWELEHCLINPLDNESRLRIIQVVLVDGTKFVLQNIRLFCEQWYGPFRNGDQFVDVLSVILHLLQHLPQKLMMFLVYGGG